MAALTGGPADLISRLFRGELRKGAERPPRLRRKAFEGTGGDPLNLIRVMPAKGQDIFSMPTSIFLAKLLGPILLVAGIAMLVNRKQLDAIGQELLRSPLILLLLGIIDLAVGLAIVLTHNVWVADWRVIVTLLGWLLMVRGTVRMLIPDQVKPLGAKLLKNANAVTGSLAVTTVLGLVLSYFGYAR
jgi:hypothetical protein